MFIYKFPVFVYISFIMFSLISKVVVRLALSKVQNHVNHVESIE